MITQSQRQRDVTSDASILIDHPTLRRSTWLSYHLSSESVHTDIVVKSSESLSNRVAVCVRACLEFKSGFLEIYGCDGPGLAIGKSNERLSIVNNN